MNRLLLDTHIWIWSLVRPEKLSQKVLGIFQDSGIQLYLSPISLWEISVLYRKKAFKATMPLSAWLGDALHQRELLEAPVTHDVIRAMQTIETPHKDPADRFLAATAAALDLTLITADRDLLAGSGYETLSNL